MGMEMVMMIWNARTRMISRIRIQINHISMVGSILAWEDIMEDKLPM